MRADLPAATSRAQSLGERALITVNATLAAGFAFVGLRNLFTPASIVASDFTVFWSAWTLILQGRASALYDAASQRAMQEFLIGGGHFEGGLMAFLNPPHAALVSAPIGWLADHLGEQVAFALWTVGNLILVVALVRTLCDEWGATTPRPRWMLVSALLGFYPMFWAIRQGQTSALLALAVVGVYRAVKAKRHWAAGSWLVVLTIKPQLVPMVIVYLAARRCWRVLFCGGVLAAISVVVTAVALGPMVWFDYLVQVRHLEHFWGTGTPEYMLNVRGSLTRIFGLEQRVWIDAVSTAVWLAALMVVGLLFVRRRIDQTQDARPAYAFAIAVALLSNPHLFIHDAVIWTVPLVLCAAALRDADGEWQPFVRFALAWPLLFAAAGSISMKSSRLLWVDPRIWAFIAATAVIERCWRSTAAPRTLSDAAPSGPVTCGKQRLTHETVPRGATIGAIRHYRC
jgi:hypothetical protein